MRGIRRARLVVVAAAACALAVVAVELPLGTLVRQRGAIAAAAERLSSIEAENARLSGQVAALRKDSTVASIAHADYGLVKAGQLAYTILPVKGAGQPARLAGGKVPAGDLVPPAASPFGSSQPSRTGPAKRSGQGLWSRVLARLAFWRSVF